MRDHASNISLVPALPPAVHTATVKGQAVDTRDANAATIIVHTGAIAGDGDFTAKVQESDAPDDDDFADAVNLVGTLPATLEASKTLKIGYIGHKRYVRLVLTKNGGTSIAASAVVELSALHERPAA
jgi:hypothetical protein